MLIYFEQGGNIMIKICLRGTDVKEFENGTTIYEVAKSISDSLARAALGGIVDGDSAAELLEKGIRIHQVLENNDAYHALERCGGLIVTGPTGTNVNDVAVVLLAMVIIPGNPLAVTRNHATRWLGIGSLTFQPSEIAKMAVVLYFADTKQRRGTRCVLAENLLKELKNVLGEENVILK